MLYLLIGYNRLEANGVTTLLGNLKELESLKRLSLSSNNVTETIADHIVCVVLKNTGLRLLDLSKVCVNAHDSIKLIKALQSLTYLQCLNLQNNYIEKDVANYLAAVIASHKDLQIFYVGYNHFQSNGVNILAKALCMLKRLKELDIMNTGISSEIGSNIADVIKCNTALEAVYFGTGCAKATTKEPESLCMEEYILQEKQHAKMVKIYYLNGKVNSRVDFLIDALLRIEKDCFFKVVQNE